MTDHHRLTDAIELSRAGRVAEAEAACREVLAEAPAHAGAVHTLGLIAYQAGKTEIAIKLLKRAIAIDPSVPDFYGNCACVLSRIGLSEDAIELLMHAIRLKPDYAEAHQNLALAYEKQGKLQEALAAHQEAQKLAPTLAASHLNAGNVLRRLGRLDEALESYRRATGIDPSFSEAWMGLADARKEQGDVAEAVACCRRAVEADPNDAVAHSRLVHTLLYLPGCDAGSISREAARWAERHAVPPARWPRSYENEPVPWRRLRIGYLSGELRAGAVALFLWTVLRERDRKGFEVICYDASPGAPDDTTYMIRNAVDGWREVANAADAELLELIRQDRVDLLVDLAGHRPANRLSVLSAKPAPVQVSLFGHPATTGLAAIDYRVTDAHGDPHDGAEGLYAERLIRLPDTASCYHPPEPAPPVVAALPARQSGGVTFACLTEPAKVNEDVAAVWAKILERLPGSRLLLLSRFPRDEFLRTLFTRHGIDGARVLVAERRARHQYLELYHFVDVALDPFPYNGDVVTCDALWMGVPVVSLAGDDFRSRRGVAHLSNLGLGELLATTREAYVETAVALARDLDRLAALRAGLRDRMLRSPASDAPRYVKHLEAAYRNMWTDWCGRNVD